MAAAGLAGNFEDTREVWWPVRGYEQFYAVSDRGRVKRLAKGKGARAEKILMPTPLSDTGYLRVGLVVGGEQVTRTVHSLVADTFIGPRPSGWSVNHKNGDKADNRLCNLEYLTLADNAKHAYEAGRYRIVRRKLTQDQAAAILAKKGTALPESLAVEHGISRTSVMDIWSGRTWRRLHQLSPSGREAQK